MKLRKLFTMLLVVALFLSVTGIAEDMADLEEGYAAKEDQPYVELGEVDLFDPNIYVEDEIGEIVDGGEQAVGAPEYDPDEGVEEWDEAKVDDVGERAVMAADNWFEAYESFVIGQGYLTSIPFAQLYAEWGAYDDYDAGWDEPQFGLYDMNWDGIPELIVYNGGTCHANVLWYAFTYQNGDVVYLDTLHCGFEDDEWFYIEGDAFPGIFSIWWGYGYAWLDYYAISSGILVTEDIAHSDDNLYIETKNEAFINLLYSKAKGRKINIMSYGDIVKTGWQGFYEYTQQIIDGAVVDISREMIPDIELSKENNNGTEMIRVGEFRWINPSFAISSGWPVSSYKSSKTKIVSIDEDGLLTAHAEGKAKITVKTANGKKATITIKVVDPYKPKGVSIVQGKSMTVNVGDVFQLNAYLAPETAKSNLTWKSSKKKVASVDGNGVVSALKEGTAKITVTTWNKKRARITIKVVDPYKPTGISIAQGKSMTVNVGDVFQLNAILAPETAQSDLTWKSGKKKVAYVDAGGVVSALKEGKAKITVMTRNKKKAKITVKVVDPYKPSGVSIAEDGALTLNAGESVQLTAALAPETARTTLTWKSSKPKVATVDANGLVTAVGKGKATITAKTANGKKAKCKVTVIGVSSPDVPIGRIELTKYIGVKFSKIRKELGISGYGDGNIAFWIMDESGKLDYAECFDIEHDPAGKYSLYGLYLGMSLSEAEASLYSQGWQQVNSGIGSYAYDEWEYAPYKTFELDQADQYGYVLVFCDESGTVIGLAKR